MILRIGSVRAGKEHVHASLSNVVDNDSDAKTMFAPEDVLQKCCLASTLVRCQHDDEMSMGLEDDTRKPERRVTGRAFGGVFGFAAAAAAAAAADLVLCFVVRLPMVKTCDCDERKREDGICKEEFSKCRLIVRVLTEDPLAWYCSITVLGSVHCGTDGPYNDEPCLYGPTTL